MAMPISSRVDDSENWVEPATSTAAKSKPSDAVNFVQNHVLVIWRFDRLAPRVIQLFSH